MRVLTRLLDDAYATLGNLIRLHELNGELLETLHVTMLWIKDYSEKNNVALPNSSTYNSLIAKAQTLIDELTQEAPMSSTFRKLSDGISQRKPSDDNFPVPVESASWIRV